MAVVVAKFECTENREIEHAPDSRQVRFTAVYSDDPSNPNSHWSKWTPSGTIYMHISNPKAFEKFVVGKQYMVNFEEA